MKNLSEIIEILRDQREELKKKYKIEEIKIFGSYVGRKSQVTLI